MSARVGAVTASTRWPLVAFSILGAIAWLLLMIQARDATFRDDDWDLVAHRSLTDPVGWLRPFNQQWIAVPAVIFRTIFGVAGMHSYLPYLGALLLLHVATAAAVWRIVSRLSGRGPGLAAATVVLFLGVGYENLDHAFQIGMVLSTATGLWAISAIGLDRRPAVAAVLLLISVASHSVGNVFVGVAIVLALADRRRSNAWLALPVAAVVLWTIAFDVTSLAARGGSFSSGIPLVPAFVLTGILTAIGSVFGSGAGLGVVILAMLCVIALRLGIRPLFPRVATATLMGLAAEYALIAIQRAEFGIGAVTWSRYLYVAVPLVLIVAAAWFGDAPRLHVRWRRPAALALIGLTFVALLGNLRILALSDVAASDLTHRERAATAIIGWSTGVRQPQFDVQMPPPAEFHDLMTRYGAPYRDDLIPSVVSPVPAPIASEICAQMLLVETQQSSCEGAVRAMVGRQ
jgi:hypothetical protein